MISPKHQVWSYICRADLNALETGDSRVGEDGRYSQMTSERQVPCLIY